VYIYIYIYIYTHTHTHTHTLIWDVTFSLRKLLDLPTPYYSQNVWSVDKLQIITHGFRMLPFAEINFVTCRMVTSGGLLWMSWWNFRFHNMQSVFWLDRELVECQEGFCSVAPYCVRFNAKKKFSVPKFPRAFIAIKHWFVRNGLVTGTSLRAERCGIRTPGVDVRHIPSAEASDRVCCAPSVLTLENGTDRSSWNVGKKLPLLPA